MRKIIFLLVTILSSHIIYSQAAGVYSLDQYLKNHKLDHLIKVESKKNILTLSGYKNGDNSTLLERKIKLDKNQVLGVNEWSFFYNSGHFKPLPISVTTVPFKVRPGFKGFKTNATSGITNVGLNLDLARWKTERYFSSGKKSTHKFYAGIWAAPLVEELDSIQTQGFFDSKTKSKQLFVSTALTINYTYNNLTFTFVPLGWDFATTPTGEKWIYNERRWWGFGIGLEPKFLNSIINN